MAVKETLWPLEPHTAAKHEILRRYLGAWFPIMSSWNQRLVYIDGFAGPGQYTGGEKGSPLIALDTAVKHQHKLAEEIVFVFIEKREDRFKHLQQVVEAYDLPKNTLVGTYHGRFAAHMTEVLDYIDEQNARLAPTFALIDPFGFSGTPMALIGRVMGNPRCEVLITFAYESVNRWLAHPKEKIQAHMDDLFGTSNWREADTLTDPPERRRFLHDLYKNELHESAGIKYVRSFEMIDRGNKTEYFLFFGTNHYAGLKKMKTVMWSVDPGAGMQFSDFTNQDQILLFEEEPDYDHLARIVLAWAGSEPRSVGQIEQFVVEDTPFAHTHFRRQVLSRLEKEGRLEVVRSTRKRKFAFPKGTIVRFIEEGDA